VMEGVALGLRDGLEIMRGMGIPVTQVRISGGGGRSPLWRQIVADVFGADVVTVTATEGAAYGAALLAGVDAGLFPSVEAACAATIRIAARTPVDPERAAFYDRLYRTYRTLYPALKPSFSALAEDTTGGPRASGGNG
ncbi:MAG: FGGY-family carbohydrate kinase, partial [Thermodesulfobacteriota bacterium]